MKQVFAITEKTQTVEIAGLGRYIDRDQHISGRGTAETGWAEVAVLEPFKGPFDGQMIPGSRLFTITSFHSVDVVRVSLGWELSFKSETSEPGRITVQDPLVIAVYRTPE